METLFWMVALPLVLLALIVLARIADQHDRDQQRQCYRLSFPAELTNEQVLTYVYAISGTLRPPIRLLGTPNPVFEVVATHHGYGYWLWVPGDYQHYTLKQLRSHVPGIHVEPEDDL